MRRRRFLATAATVGLAAGLSASEARADGGGSDACVPDIAKPKYQLRAAWFATVVNIDWPSAPGLTIEQQQAEYHALLDVLDTANCNAVILQVRPAADAFYASAYEPWSQYLTGTQGEDPGYDPLAWAVEATHERGMELHAWFNPYRANMSTDTSNLAPNHPAIVHPDWVRPYGGRLYFDPGLPATRDHIVAVIGDVVTRYDIDGVHFDDYFYPYPVSGETFDDDAAFAEYGGGFDNKGDWRRDNVNSLIRDLGREIHAIKPWVKWGISPFGIWRNKATDPLGSQTNGLQSYDEIFADSRRWVKEGWIDYINPQIYWHIGFSIAAYDVLMPWWADVVDGTDVALYIGQAAYRIGDTSTYPEWGNPEEMPNHILMNRDYPQVKGDVYFSAKSLQANPLGFHDRLTSDLYAAPAFVPVISHLGGAAPAQVRVRSVRPVDGGVAVTWPSVAGAARYAVYRFDEARVDDCDYADASHLVAVAPAVDGAVQRWVDTAAEADHRYSYSVSALDRLWHEGKPSRPLTVVA